MSLGEALEPGWAVAVCARCVNTRPNDAPPGATFDGPWPPYYDMPCASCAETIATVPGGYTAHPSLQRCYACDERKDAASFNKHNWMKLQAHGICETCRLAYPALVAQWRREGLEVRKFGRVIGRLEGCPPPADDPYRKDNRDAYWRVVYCPEPLPRRTAPAPEVLTDTCTDINGGRMHLRHWHGRGPEDQAFTWVEDYRRRWRALHGDEPPQVEWFLAADVTKRWGSGCIVCAGPFEHLDHWVPIASRGRHELENVRPMCATHNLAKGDRLDVST